MTKRLWAHAHFGSRFIRRGALRVEATVSGDATNSLNVTAFANTDGTTAVQIINNGNSSETVTLAGLTLARNPVVTWLSNQQNNLTQGYAQISNGNQAVAQVPAKSLLSFVVAASGYENNQNGNNNGQWWKNGYGGNNGGNHGGNNGGWW